MDCVRCSSQASNCPTRPATRSTSWTSPCQRPAPRRTSRTGRSSCVPERRSGRPKIVLRIGTRNAACRPRAIRRRISAASRGVGRSSASIDSTQSPVAASRAALRCRANVSNARRTHAATVGLGDRDRRVARAAVDDDDLVDPIEPREQLGEIRRFVRAMIAAVSVGLGRRPGDEVRPSLATVMLIVGLPNGGKRARNGRSIADCSTRPPGPTRP